jgi:5'-methylthioinosine phosphorylase
MSDKSTTIAIIGGTGLNTFQQGSVVGERHTPFGETSADIAVASVAGRAVLFLPRHGSPHIIPPHRINYRANLWQLNQLGVNTVIAVNAVGSIRADLLAGSMVVPDQLVDYTYGREHTFSDGLSGKLEHIDFTYPFTESLRLRLSQAAQQQGLVLNKRATYAAVQGPRLETAAEVDRLERDGCDIVGMTVMPEAALARELGMDYASVCLVVNPAAGRSNSLISMDEIHRVVATGMVVVKQLLIGVVPLL